jgi:hypothetical protein
MFAAPRRGTLSLALMVLAASCGGGGSEPTGTNPGTTAAAVAVVSGNGQAGLVGSTLSLPLVVKVSTSAGAAVSGASVAFAVTSGAATVSPATAVTDAAGQAKTSVTLGSAAGNVTITATVAGTSLSTAFLLTAGTTVASAACSSGAPQTLALGEVRPGVSGTGICLSGGAEYALVAFNSNPDSNMAQTSVTVRGQGAIAVTTADQAPAFNTAEASSPLRANRVNLQRSFDLHLRDIARRELTPLIPAARAAYRSHAGFSVIPKTVNIGDVITLNANGNQACTNLINIGARVAAITTNTIVVADTANPAGGFTDAEYASFGTTFDTLVSPLDVNAFGKESDIDGNGKIVILFTKEVNKLTPRGSFGFIGGFFFERDLFPTSDTPTFQGCKGSNVGEMFYVLVPDPNAVFSDKRTKTDVLSNTIGTLAHEYQHLINASRRLYVNNAGDFETVWLNEGLSHIAEELAYYRESKNAPRQNIGITQLAPDSGRIFNQYEADNFGRYEVFIGKPNQTGVYAVNDSLETRGATWSLLRYLADHRGSSDADTWQLLVNATVQGQENLSRVFGSNYMTQIRDWATTVFTDDVAGVTNATFLEPSWNFRSIFPRLCSNSACTVTLNKYPLTVIGVSDAAPGTASIVAGGAAYFRFSANAGGQASIDWSSAGLPVSPFVQFTVVRTK